MAEDWGASRLVGPLFDSESFANGGDIEIACPADKSITHRAIIFAALSKGRSVIHRPLLGADCLSTIDCFRKMGVSITISDNQNSLVLDSPGWDGLHSPSEPLDFGNSGTTARLLLGILAASPHITAQCLGDQSLSKRPMARVVEPLRKMGAQIEANDERLTLPLKVSGQDLAAVEYVYDKASAQVKSCVILAGLNIAGTTNISLPKGSRNHTEIFLNRLGAELKVVTSGEREVVSVAGPFRPESFELAVPGDPSSAAFFAVLAAITARGVRWILKDVLQNSTRNGFITCLEDAGVCLELRKAEGKEQKFAEPIMDIVITSGRQLRSFDIQGEQVANVIDEVPILAVLASFSGDGLQSSFRDLAELRVKESDRLAKTCELLEVAGVPYESGADHISITGIGPRPVKPFRFNPEGDHRLAMAAAVLATRASDQCEILGAQCVDVSFPGFFDLLTSLG